MSDANPYAPPAAGDTQAPASHIWLIDGIGLLVKNGAVLPMVDLETGEHEPAMKSIHRVYHPVRSTTLIPVAASFLVTVVALRFHRESLLPVILLVYLVAFAVSLGLQRKRAARGQPMDRVVIWEFLGMRTFAGRHRRRKLRRRAALGIAVLLLLFPILFSAATRGAAALMLLSFSVGLTSLAGLSVWGLLDRPIARNRAAPPGWMRISPVHPHAITFLRDAEQGKHAPPGSPPGSGQRLARTVYYHRFPLRLLVGNKRNPLLLCRIFLLKLERSSLLEIDTYHFSEATPAPAHALCPPLQRAIESWLAAQPDWTFIGGTHLGSPSDRLTVESALVSSPGLVHSAIISHSWPPTTPDQGVTTVSLATWLTDGTALRSHDHPFIGLKLPHGQNLPGRGISKVHDSRVSGTPAQVLRAHLKRCTGKPLAPPRDAAELLARVRRHQEEADTLLTALGYQSELRVVR